MPLEDSKTFLKKGGTGFIFCDEAYEELDFEESLDELNDESKEVHSSSLYDIEIEDPDLYKEFQTEVGSVDINSSIPTKIIAKKRNETKRFETLTSKMPPKPSIGREVTTNKYKMQAKTRKDIDSFKTGNSKLDKFSKLKNVKRTKVYNFSSAATHDSKSDKGSFFYYKNSKGDESKVSASTVVSELASDIPKPDLLKSQLDLPKNKKSCSIMIIGDFFVDWIEKTTKTHHYLVPSDWNIMYKHRERMDMLELNKILDPKENSFIYEELKEVTHLFLFPLISEIVKWIDKEVNGTLVKLAHSTTDYEKLRYGYFRREFENIVDNILRLKVKPKIFMVIPPMLDLVAYNEKGKMEFLNYVKLSEGENKGSWTNNVFRYYPKPDIVHRDLRVNLQLISEVRMKKFYENHMNIINMNDAMSNDSAFSSLTWKSFISGDIITFNEKYEKSPFIDGIYPSHKVVTCFWHTVNEFMKNSKGKSENLKCTMYKSLSQTYSKSANQNPEYQSQFYQNPGNHTSQGFATSTVQLSSIPLFQNQSNASAVVSPAETSLSQTYSQSANQTYEYQSQFYQNSGNHTSQGLATPTVQPSLNPAFQNQSNATAVVSSAETSLSQTYSQSVNQIYDYQSQFYKNPGNHTSTPAIQPSSIPAFQNHSNALAVGSSADRSLSQTYSQPANQIYEYQSQFYQNPGNHSSQGLVTSTIQPSSIPAFQNQSNATAIVSSAETSLPQTYSKSVNQIYEYQSQLYQNPGNYTSQGLATPIRPSSIPAFQNQSNATAIVSSNETLQAQPSNAFDPTSTGYNYILPQNYKKISPAAFQNPELPIHAYQDIPSKPFLKTHTESIPNLPSQEYFNFPFSSFIVPTSDIHKNLPANLCQNELVKQNQNQHQTTSNFTNQGSTSISMLSSASCIASPVVNMADTKLASVSVKMPLDSQTSKPKDANKNPSSLPGFINRFSDIRLKPHTCSSIIVVGTHKLIAFLKNQEAKNINFINCDLSAITEAYVPEVVQQLKMSVKSLLPHKTVCFLGFDVNAFLKIKVPVSPGCKTINCKEVMPVFDLNTEHPLVENIEVCIQERINEIEKFATKLSKHIPTILLPLFPSEITCEDIQKQAADHFTSHILYKQGYTIVCGKKETWIFNLETITQHWNNLTMVSQMKHISPKPLAEYFDMDKMPLMIKEDLSSGSSIDQKLLLWRGFIYLLYKEFLEVSEESNKNVEQLSKHYEEAHLLTPTAVTQVGPLLLAQPHPAPPQPDVFSSDLAPQAKCHSSQSSTRGEDNKKSLDYKSSKSHRSTTHKTSESHTNSSKSHQLLSSIKFRQRSRSRTRRQSPSRSRRRSRAKSKRSRSPVKSSRSYRSRSPKLKSHRRSKSNSRSSSRSHRSHSRSHHSYRSCSRSRSKSRSHSRLRRKSPAKSHHRSRSRSHGKHRSKPSRSKSLEVFGSMDEKTAGSTDGKTADVISTIIPDLRQLLGVHYEEFAQAENDMKASHEEEWEVFKSFPKLHPDYDTRHETFSTEFNKKRGKRDDEEIEKAWTPYWESSCHLIKQTDYENLRSNLINDYQKKVNKPLNSPPIKSDNSAAPSPSKPLSSHLVKSDRSAVPSASKPLNFHPIKSDHSAAPPAAGSPSAAKFSVEGTLDLLEQLCGNQVLFGVFAPSLLALIKCARESDPNSEKGLEVFVDEENTFLLRKIIEKLKIALTRGSSVLVPILSQAIHWTEQLMEHAKNSPKQSKMENFDIDEIAKASYGKDAACTLNLIRMAHACNGISLPVNEVNELFMKVCSIHFSMQMEK